MSFFDPLLDIIGYDAEVTRLDAVGYDADGGVLDLSCWAGPLLLRWRST
jgi:hypothetical protein